MNSLQNILHQRKRWMQVLKPIPFLIRIGFLLRLLSIPILIFGALYSPILGIGFLLIIGMLGLVIRKMFRRIDQPLSLLDVLSFVGYELVIYFLTFAIYLLPIPINWKNRYY